MLFRFKKDYVVSLDNLDDKYVDNCFIFRKDYCYYGYFDHDNLIVESIEKDVKAKLNKYQIKEYIDWKGL